MPHDQGGSDEPLVLAVDENGSGTVIAWEPIGGALFYNVVRGSLGALRERDGVYDLGDLICITSATTETVTGADPEKPLPGEAFFYLAEYNDGLPSGYGTASAAKERSASSSQSDCP